MKAFLHNQFRSLRTHGNLLLIILVLTQMAIIGLMLLANQNLRAVYNESVNDNVKLFIDNYELRLKQEECESEDEEQQQEDLDINPKGFMKV